MKRVVLILVAVILLIVGGYLLWPHKTVKASKELGGDSGQGQLSLGKYQQPTQAETISPEAILQDVNKERVSSGLQPLAENPTIMSTAKEKCDDMVANNYYGHQNPKTGEMGVHYVFDALSVKGAAENLVGDAPTIGSQGLVDKWMASPRHKANILDPRFTDTGVAVCNLSIYPNSVVAVQQFAQL